MNRVSDTKLKLAVFFPLPFRPNFFLTCDTFKPMSLALANVEEKGMVNSLIVFKLFKREWS